MTAMGFEDRYDSARSRGDWPGALAALEDGVRAGNAFAAGQLGVWRLLGHTVERDDAAGFTLVRQAARAGLPEARLLMATLHARGRGTAQDWSKAVEWLVRGGRAGDAQALRQLAFLLPDAARGGQLFLLDGGARAGDIACQRKLDRLFAGPAPARPAARPDWAKIKRMARRPELAQGPVQALSERPPIYMRTGVLDGDLCDYLICVALPHLARARVNDAYAGAELISESRTNMFANFWLLEGDTVTDSVDRMLAALTGQPVENGEPLSVLRYRPGEQFAPHFDYFDPEASAHAGPLAEGGQRIVTCLVYLNTAYEGGETSFLDLDLSFRGGAGDAAYWRNVDADGRLETLTRHAGLPPSSGEKWLVSKWFRDRPQTGVPVRLDTRAG